MNKNELQRLEELESRVAILEQKNAARKIPSGLKIGDTFELAGTVWKILDITNDGYSCLADSIGEMEFDSESNNWANSDLRDYLVTEFLDKLKEVHSSFYPRNIYQLSCFSLTLFQVKEAIDKKKNFLVFLLS